MRKQPTFYSAMNTFCYRILVAGPVVVLFLTQSVTGQVCSCPLGWKTQRGNPHCYYLSAKHESVATFTEAQARCLPSKGHLISLNSYDEFYFFESIRNSTSSWIGAKYDRSLMKWIWVTGEDVGDWADPFWGELSDDGSRQYAFVMENGVWVDREEGEEHPYICEKEGLCQTTVTTTFQATIQAAINQKTTTDIMTLTVEEDVATENSSIVPQAANGVTKFLGAGLGAGAGLLSVLGCVFVLVVMKQRAVQRERNKHNCSAITRVPADEENLPEVGLNQYEDVRVNDYASVDEDIVPCSKTAHAIGNRGTEAIRIEATLQCGNEAKEPLYAMPDANHRARERENGHIDDEAGTELVENDVYGD